MEVQKEILEKLKCSVCSEYLSYSPVYQLDDGNSVCGRCSLSEEQSGIRILPYEQLASKFQFPCSFTQYGCTAKPLFTETKKHEDNCKYKPFNCVVTVNSGKCDWIGSKFQILEHTRNEHPEQVIEHPAQIQHEYNKNSNRTFILIVFDLCFLLHAKVCLKTKKIYHCVRLLAGNEDSHKFYYDLEIFNKNGNKLTRRGKVAPPGSRVIKENRSDVININTIVEWLSVCKDTIFKFTIKSNTTVDTKESDEKLCFKCLKIIEENAYPNSKGEWFCMNCVEIEFCDFKKVGCTYKDTPFKVIAHIHDFCDKKPIKKNPYIYFMPDHPNDIFPIDTTFTVSIYPSFSNLKSVVITSDIGRFILRYFWNISSKTLTFEVYSTLHRGELYLYQCELQLKHPNSLEITNKILNICCTDSYDNDVDWTIKIKENELIKYVHSTVINLKLILTKKR